MVGCWVLCDDKVGLINQCLGLTDAAGLAPEMKQAEAKLPWRWLPARAWPDRLDTLRPAYAFAPPWPRVLIAAGRSAAAPAAALKRRLGHELAAIVIQEPRLDLASFDLAIIPRHDALAHHLPTGDNILLTDGALHRVTPARLAEAKIRFANLLAPLPRPLVAVLIGGPTRYYRFGAPEARALALTLMQRVRTDGIGLAVTVSRRTPPPVVATLREALADAPALFHEGGGDNPYLGLLSLADHLLVTADSVSMVSEAAATGKPVHVIGLKAQDPRATHKFALFHQHFQNLGITRPFLGGPLEEWRYPSPQDNARAAAAVQARLES